VYKFIQIDTWNTFAKSISAPRGKILFCCYCELRGQARSVFLRRHFFLANSRLFRFHILFIFLVFFILPAKRFPTNFLDKMPIIKLVSNFLELFFWSILLIHKQRVVLNQPLAVLVLLFLREKSFLHRKLLYQHFK
jgi:hypothetical protein